MSVIHLKNYYQTYRLPEHQHSKKNKNDIKKQIWQIVERCRYGSVWTVSLKQPVLRAYRALTIAVNDCH